MNYSVSRGLDFFLQTRSNQICYGGDQLHGVSYFVHELEILLSPYFLYFDQSQDFLKDKLTKLEQCQLLNNVSQNPLFWKMN